MNTTRYIAAVVGALAALSLLGTSTASARSHSSHHAGSHRHPVSHHRETHRLSKPTPETNVIAPAAPTISVPSVSAPSVSAPSVSNTSVSDHSVSEPSVSRPPLLVFPRLQLPYFGAPVYRKISDRSHFYIAQATSYTCGPSVLAMAIADHVLGKPPTLALVRELTKETGTRKSDGMPDWWNVVPAAAAKHGLETSVHVLSVGDKTAMDTLDAELLRGHSAFVHVNNPRTKSGNGHFIYVAGKTANGGYVIGNPDEPANSALGHNKEVSRQAIEDMMVNPPKSHPKYYKGVPGFVAVWGSTQP